MNFKDFSSLILNLRQVPKNTLLFSEITSIVNTMLLIDRSQIHLSTMDMPKASKYGNLGEIYFATITNYTWIILLIIGCLICLFIQFISIKIYHKFIDRIHSEINDKAKIKAIAFAQSVQSLIHSIVMCMVCVPLIVNYGLDIDSALNQEENKFIIAYKICTVFSTSYFIIATYYDLMVLPHTKLMRFGMVFHHFLCIINQSQIFVVTSAGALMSSLGIQVELSTIFLCIKDMAKLAKNKRIYCVSGVLLMVFYPLTRIGFLPYVIYIIYESKHLFEEWTGLGAYYLLLTSFSFVVMMSLYFYCLILRHPTKHIILRDKGSRSVSKSISALHELSEHKIEIEISQELELKI